MVPVRETRHRFVSVRLTDGQRAKLDAIAEAQNVKISDIVNEALRRLFEAEKRKHGKGGLAA